VEKVTLVAVKMIDGQNLSSRPVTYETKALMITIGSHNSKIGFNVISPLISCRNLSLRLTTKARGCKVVGQEGSLGVMPHAPESARECEGIDPHTPKGTPTLGIGVIVDSRMFRE
jgi:hypothetical protein